MAHLTQMPALDLVLPSRSLKGGSHAFDTGRDMLVLPADLALCMFKSWSASAMQVGANLMLLNGHFLDVANLDLFSILDRIRKEVRVASEIVGCHGHLTRILPATPPCAASCVRQPRAPLAASTSGAAVRVP